LQEEKRRQRHYTAPRQDSCRLIACPACPPGTLHTEGEPSTDSSNHARGTAHLLKCVMWLPTMRLECRCDAPIVCRSCVALCCAPPKRTHAYHRRYMASRRAAFNGSTTPIREVNVGEYTVAAPTKQRLPARLPAGDKTPGLRKYERYLSAGIRPRNAPGDPAIPRPSAECCGA